MADWSPFYQYASSQLGVPYLYGGTGNGGFDCSGFTQAVYQRAGVQIGRDTTAQLRSGETVGSDGNWAADIAQLEPGDLIFYGQPGASGPNADVVMYIGNNQVIQAGGSNVNVTSLFQSASPTDPFLGVRRYTSFVNAPKGPADPNGVTSMGPPGNTSAPSASTSASAADSMNAIVTSVAQQIAARYGVDPNRLTQIALAVMQVEDPTSDPTVVGDNGTSYGLFQLHQGGELGNLTEQQAFDPTTNAQTAIAVIASVLKSNPGYDNGQIAALAQRPADPAAYASDVNQIIAGGTQNIGMGQTAGISGTAATGTNPVDVPGLNDIPGLDAYIRTNLGADAWLLDIPGSAGAQLKNIIETAVATGHGGDAAYITTQIQGSDWYKTTSANVRNFTQQSQTDPANYNFGTPGSIAAQQLQDVKAIAASAGVTITDANARSLAMDVLMYGWDANQLKAAIGSSVYINGTGATQTTDAGPVLTQLQSSAGQYLINPQDPVLQTFAQGIVSGTQTIDQYDAWLKQQASLKWTGMAPQIAQGYTPNQIVNNLRQNAAQTMEVDPSSINFVTDPTYQKVLDYVPPNSPNGVHRIMTQSEMDQYLKATPQWASTQQSRDQIGNLAQTITSTLGKVAG